MKGSFSATIKLLLYDVKVMGSSRENNLLQCRVKLRTIDFFSGLRIDVSFVHRTALF